MIRRLDEAVVVHVKRQANEVADGILKLARSASDKFLLHTLPTHIGELILDDMPTDPA